MDFGQDITIGIRDGWGQQSHFGISHEDRRRHLYILGQTGVGKTTLLRNLALQDILAGRGMGMLDPHGEGALSLLDYIPPWRIPDVVYFDPADRQYPVAFNLLVGGENPHLVASAIVGAFKSIWRDSWGPRLEYILFATVAALLECENVSLLGVQRMFTDARYRAWVVKQVKDPMVHSFWVNEFEGQDRKFIQEAVAPVQNKIGILMMSPIIRNVLGQVKSKIEARSLMDNRHIFIANLSKGRVGEIESILIGALLVAQFQQAALSRADIPEDEREDWPLYVDEFHSFTSDSFASILSEARKYRLCLTLSHQYIEQVRPEIREAIFGNVGGMIAFRLGQRDAEVLEKEFGGEFAAAHFTRLGRHEVNAKLLSAGDHSEPFTGKTLPPIGKRYGRAETVISRSRERYATKREVVEDKIQRWLG